VCNDAGTVQVKPGLTFEPRDVRISLTLDLFDCSSSDPSISGGVVTARADGPAFTCAGGQIVNGTATFQWNNGRSSRLSWSATATGPVAVATGTIVGGSEFVGEPFAGYVAPAIPSPPPLACASPEGLTEFDVSGTDVIGVPGVSG
jgi:hypothetical protein